MLNEPAQSLRSHYSVWIDRILIHSALLDYERMREASPIEAKETKQVHNNASVH